MALTKKQVNAQITKAVENAPLATQQRILGGAYSAGKIVTLEDVNRADGLKIEDYQNIIEPLLINKVFKTQFDSFVANNPYGVFYDENSPWGRQKEHILSIYATMVNLQGQTQGQMKNIIMSAGYKEKDLNPSTLDWFDSEDIVYYTNHIRAFVMTASLNQTEIKAAFRGINTFNEYLQRKTDVLLEHAKQEESAIVATKLAELMLPQKIGMLKDNASAEKEIVTAPKITLLGENFPHADFVNVLRTYVNNIKFPELAITENPLSLPLITPSERLITFVTPNFMTSQDFLEAYAFTSSKISLPTTTEMMAPLPMVKLENADVSTIGEVTGAIDGKFTGTVLPVAFIGDTEILDINRSEFYTDIEINKLREFMTPQVHDHISVHPSFEKNVRFFAIVVDADVPTLVAPGDFTAETSGKGKNDATLNLPTTLKDSKGADVQVNAMILDANGATVSNGLLKAGKYTVSFSASGYAPVTANATVKDKPELIAPTETFTATTSGAGKEDGRVTTLPTSLKDTEDNDVSVSIEIQDSNTAIWENGKLKAGNYTAYFNADGYKAVSAKVVISDPSK